MSYPKALVAMEIALAEDDRDAAVAAVEEFALFIGGVDGDAPYWEWKALALAVGDEPLDQPEILDLLDSADAVRAEYGAACLPHLVPRLAQLRERITASQPPSG
jgi:hypothetical protein